MIQLLLIIAAFVQSASATPEKTTCLQFSQVVAKGNPAQQIKGFVDLLWKYQMTEFPEAATFNGYPGQNDRWTDQSLEAVQRRHKEDACLLASLHKIPRAKLNADGQLNFDLIERDLKLGVEGQKFGGDYLAVNHMNGIQTEIVDVLVAMPTASVHDYRNILARLEKIPASVDQVIGRLQEGLKQKITATKMLLPKIPEQIDNLTPAKIQDSPLYKPFVDMNSTLAKADQDSMRTEAQQILKNRVYPALVKFKDFMNKEYIPAARESIAWADLPNGKAWYDYMIKTHTTTARTAEDLHETGLREVSRINGEMTRIMTDVGYKGSAKDFNHMLMTDSRFYFSTPEEVLTAFRDITKRIDPELVHMFHNLPRLTYGVREVPAFRAPSSPGGEYQPGTPDGGRAGWFEANVYNLKTRPKWEMESLAFHEAVPGHHLQIAVAQELKNLPDFRRYGGNTAYVEGWALYAESLGEEMGFYKDPYSRFGHYADEMLRAVRLVVDTGMHAKGWSRQQAIDYYQAQMPASKEEAVEEIDRYIVWPGQALAYKVGQMKIRELRERAAATLGNRFDVRQFHDVILGQGPLPMDILESVVDNWIHEQNKKKKAV